MNEYYYSHYDASTNFDYVQFAKSRKAQGMSKSINTSFSGYLVQSILQLIESENSASLRKVTERYGNFPQVHEKIKEMCLENKIFLYFANKDETDKSFDNMIYKIVDENKSIWNPFNAQPCLTCPIMDECGIENPVSPATCEEFQFWLEAEIDLEKAKQELRDNDG